jgi:hypothetical protein|tara:strand:- start:78642 stop:79424 length:783 start_codon:yes stop_codon:yes gene_type:complete
MYKLAQLYLLPSKDEDGYSIKKGIKNGHTYMQWDNLGECPHGFYNPYHLYLTSDEDIEDGDWCIHYSHGVTTLVQINLITEKNCTSVCGKNMWLDYCRKIIATTDLKLKVPAIYKLVTPTSEGNVSSDLIGSKSLPQIPKAFLNGYCIKQGEIGDVMVEFEVTNRCCGRCDGVHDECVTDMICHDHIKMGCPECFGPRGDVVKLKLNSDNKIIIEPTRDKWNRKELDVILENLTNEVYNTFRNKKHASFDLDNWKNINLK